MPEVSDFNIEEFLSGSCRNAYNFFGVHKKVLFNEEGNEIFRGYIFRVFAPNAFEVYVMGNWNSFESLEYRMNKIHESGIYELFIKDIKEFYFYQYLIVKKDGEKLFRKDPFCFFNDLQYKQYSKIFDLTKLNLPPDELRINEFTSTNRPISIYEIDIFKFKKNEDLSFYSYGEIGKTIYSYLDDLGFKTINFKNKSLEKGTYLFTGFYSVNSLLGTPEDFQKLILDAHDKGFEILVDFDITFSNFLTDLVNFDGTDLYLKFKTNFKEKYKLDLSKGFVRSFVISSINFLIKFFRIDGIVIKNLNECFSNEIEKNEIAKFVKDVNDIIHEKHPTFLIIGEEFNDSFYLTSLHNESLNCDLKMDVNFYKNILNFFSKDFASREKEILNNSISSFFKEKFLLPISSFGDRTIVNNFFGDLFSKIEQLKLAYTYMFSHPGKKLIFMGEEMANISTFNEKFSFDLSLMRKENHSGVYKLVRDLNMFYKLEKAMWFDEFNSQFLNRISTFDIDPNIFVFNRKAGNSNLYFVFNISNNTVENFTLPLENEIYLREIFNSSSSKYGGPNLLNNTLLKSKAIDGKFSIDIKVGPNTGLILKVVE